MMLGHFAKDRLVVDGISEASSGEPVGLDMQGFVRVHEDGELIFQP
jgi:hypothetical protein